MGLRIKKILREWMELGSNGGSELLIITLLIVTLWIAFTHTI